MRTDILTQELAKELLRYDDESGNLYWKARARMHFQTDRACSMWNARYPLAEAGHKGEDGYIVIGILSTLYKAHRVIYLMCQGILPKEVDHIDGDKGNNRIANLRAASRRQNMANYSKPENNTSGYKGVSWSRSSRKWKAYIKVMDKQKHLGCFPCKIEAAKAYNAAANKYHGEFAKLNGPRADRSRPCGAKPSGRTLKSHAAADQYRRHKRS